jgi:N-hydroxyarylamine O-acetyltransferase
MNSISDSTLPPVLIERVLERLTLQRRPEPTLDGLRTVYTAWCRHVPFDNIRKLIHLRSGNGAPLPGTTPHDYFDAWLKFGTGGTCWSGAGALHALLTGLGFYAVRGVGTMLAAPDLPPNHGTVRVTFDSENYLVDSSILHGEPLRLSATEETAIAHPAWGIRCSQKEGRLHIAWRPLHKTDGFQCRLERFGAAANDYQTFYEATRSWSPFNYEVVKRINRDGKVIGLAFGHAVTLGSDGGVDRAPVSHQERMRLLIEEFGLSEEIVRQLPEDSPTPPPTGSRTARTNER